MTIPCTFPGSLLSCRTPHLWTELPGLSVQDAPLDGGPSVRDAGCPDDAGYPGRRGLSRTTRAVQDDAGCPGRRGLSGTKGPTPPDRPAAAPGPATRNYLCQRPGNYWGQRPGNYLGSGARSYLGSGTSKSLCASSSMLTSLNVTTFT